MCDGIAGIMQVLARVTEVTVEHLYEFATDRNASHVARRLLCVLAGFDVMPAQHSAASMDGSAAKANKVRRRPHAVNVALEATSASSCTHAAHHM